MKFLLDRILRRLIQIGALDVAWPDGSRSVYSGASGNRAAVRITSEKTISRVILNSALTFGEAYMDGEIVLDGCTIYDLFMVLSSNLSMVERLPPVRAVSAIRRAMRPITQANDARRARRNATHHYDLNGQLYSLFLDQDRQYSGAYFPRRDETIEKAQTAKKNHIATKLLLDKPGLSVLDIGCGSGGMALTLARDYGARVTGITLSVEQLNDAQVRAEAEGLSDRVRFELRDYRDVRDSFDRIVSIGMFEHVGVPNYGVFFETLRRCLKPGGNALLHAIGRFDGPAATNPWITKYIFPGGYCPSLSEVFAALEKTGLKTADIEILRLHYAKTLAHWRERFATNRDAIASLYDQRFCRMFEFHLAAAELAFRQQSHMVFQMQIVRQQDAVPLTRDYMFESERAAIGLSVGATITHDPA